jgi:hypothetical protein|tara:strand:+ start:432 stop:983 length:552 start_codon:yes stop_codon:yes gene_type:complete
MINKVIKLFEQEELQVLQKYCDNKLAEGCVIDELGNTPAWYADSLMTALLDVKQFQIEQEYNLKLFPTYAFWRYYVIGGRLPKHTDRPSCEISATACIKKHDDWPIIIEGKSIELKEGEAVVYRGCEQEHYRPGTYKGDGMAQVFFHYVDQNGPFTHHAYDKHYKETGEKQTPEDEKFYDKKV